jgi:hypothetical protein
MLNNILHRNLFRFWKVVRHEIQRTALNCSKQWIQSNWELFSSVTCNTAYTKHTFSSVTLYFYSHYIGTEAFNLLVAVSSVQNRLNNHVQIYVCQNFYPVMQMY